MKDLTILQDTIQYEDKRSSDSLVFVRGDANASFNPRDKNKRDELFRYFAEENKLCCVQIHQKTYHHFRGNGISDSNIDVILHPKVTSAGLPNMATESLTKVLCGKVNPWSTGISLIRLSHLFSLTAAVLMNQKLPPSSSKSPTVCLLRLLKQQTSLLN